MKILRLTEETRSSLSETLSKRSPNAYGAFEKQVSEILLAVKERGDAAVIAYTNQYDGASLTKEQLAVTEEEIREAYAQVDQGLLCVMQRALKNIRAYHEKQLKTSWFDSSADGVILGQKLTALDAVGVYVPGGKAAYPSSVFMNVIPAKVAGVGRIVMTTPPGADGKIAPFTLVAAKEAGVDQIYKAGGAQAIGALAFGTETIPKVDKIVEPGNIYVALAKKAVFGHVSIDSIAGPAKFWCLRMRLQTRGLRQRIFSHRQSMTRWRLPFSSPRAKRLQERSQRRSIRLHKRSQDGKSSSAHWKITAAFLWRIRWRQRSRQQMKLPRSIWKSSRKTRLR